MHIRESVCALTGGLVILANNWKCLAVPLASESSISLLSDHFILPFMALDYFGTFLHWLSPSNILKAHAFFVFLRYPIAR